MVSRSFDYVQEHFSKQDTAYRRRTLALYYPPTLSDTSDAANIIDQSKEPYQRHGQAKTEPAALTFPLDLSELCIPETNSLLLEEPSKTVCMNGELSPFVHQPPHFLNNTDDERLFMIQPENTDSLQVDWVNWSWKTCVTLRPGTNQLVGHIPAVQAYSFQHFHDNGLALVFQMRQLFDAVQKAVAPCRFEETLFYEHPRDEILMDEWKLLGFPSTARASNGRRRRKRRRTNSDKFRPRKKRRTKEEILANEVTIERYPRDKDQMRVHSSHVQWLRSKFPPEPTTVNRNKVVWISRQQGHGGGGNKRQFSYQNESAVVQDLQQKIPGLVYFHPEQEQLTTVADLTSFLYDVCAIVSLHGGQLYNQFFANTRTSIIELVSVKKNGLLDGQSALSELPSLAHRANWHNANLLGQPYWRLHFSAPRATDFVFNQTTLERIVQAVGLSGCKVNQNI